MFGTLRAEMARISLKTKDVAEVAGLSDSSLRNKMSGRNEFSRKEMLTIRNKLFPKFSIEELFDMKQQQNTA